MLHPLTRTALIALAAGGMFFSAGCGDPKISRTDANTTVDLSGKWNDTDSRLVSQEMIGDALKRPWLDNFIKAKSKNPFVVPGKVTVRSNGDEISTEIFVNDIRRELLNSGRVSLVSSKVDKAQTRSEIEDQQKYSGVNTKEAAKEMGADFLLLGKINVQDDIQGRTAVKFYSIDMELTDIESGQVVWIGNKKIKKIVENASTR